MRVKQLMKDNKLEKAAHLAKACYESPSFNDKVPFKQMYLVCLCATSTQDELMDQVSVAALKSMWLANVTVLRLKQLSGASSQ